jgi:hypothetical protein
LKHIINLTVHAKPKKTNLKRTKSVIVQKAISNPMDLTNKRDIMGVYPSIVNDPINVRYANSIETTDPILARKILLCKAPIPALIPFQVQHNSGNFVTIHVKINETILDTINREPALADIKAKYESGKLTNMRYNSQDNKSPLDLILNNKWVFIWDHNSHINFETNN